MSSAKSKEKPAPRRRGLPSLLLATGLVAGIAAYLSDCDFGLGWGQQLGLVDKAEPEAETEPKPEPDSEPAPQDEGSQTPRLRSFVVEGERCREGEDPFRACSELCEGLTAAQEPPVKVEINATAGTHAAVQALQACLKKAGYEDLVMRSE